MDDMSEYNLPDLPTQTTAMLVPLNSKKIQLIKSLPTKSTTIKPTTSSIPQTSISIFLTPAKKSSSLTARKSSLLDRIRAKQAIEPPSTSTKLATAAWERGEWCIASLFLYPPSHSLY